MERNKFPIGSEHYELYEEVGQGVSASVLRALCKPNNEIVAIKIIDFERNNSDLNKIAREAQTMLLVDHPNVLKAYCSFVSEQTLWVIMPFMEGGSCLHILKAAYPDGFKETVIATILREVLKGLEYLHQHGQIHRDVKAGNILVDAHGAIKLGDFGVSACLFDCGDRQRSRNTFVGTPCWMAPEVMEQLNGYDFKADIWSFGITAMELAHGHAPFSKYPPMKVLLMTLQNSPPGLDNERDKKFSRSFKQMIAMCLVKQPSKRPSARKLLKHPFFKQARSNDYIHRTILEGLPTLGDRIKELKRKDEAMLAQKKMPDGEKEEISQNEYKRGISAWDFNVEDMKAQAALIQDGEDVIAEKDQAEISIPVHELDLQEKQPQLSSINHCLKGDGAQKDSDMMPNGTYPLPALSLSMNHLSLSDRHNKTEDDVSIAGSNSSCEQCTLQEELPRDIDRIEHHWSVKPEEGISGRCSNGVPPRSPHNRGASSQINLQELASEQDSDRQNQNWNGQAVEDLAPETLLKPSKLPVAASNGESSDEKQKRPVVQQKGRFQVSSEKPNLEKASPSPMLQKSHSLQVMSQSLTSSLAGEATSSNPQGLSVFLHLHDMLQLNIAERDLILLMMKKLPSSESTGNRAVGENSPSVASFPERSLMEAANEREKELLQELEELHWRLEAAQEELQKFKMKNAQV